MKLPLASVCLLVGLGLEFTSAVTGAPAEEAQRLRLVPFPKRVTLTGGALVYVTFVSREAGPIPNQEPETEWPRWSDVYVVTMAEWAAP